MEVVEGSIKVVEDYSEVKGGSASMEVVEPSRDFHGEIP